MLERIIPFSHSKVSEVLTKNDIAIDATCGNGNDTVFLGKLAKHVYAFDVQVTAIENTKKKCIEEDVTNVTLLLEGHEHLSKHVTEPVKVVMFNLGYLPRSDKQITTIGSNTIQAVKQACDILCVNGLIVLTVYVGHDEGKVESSVLDSFTSMLPSRSYQVLKYQFTNKIDAPYILFIEKINDK